MKIKDRALHGKNKEQFGTRSYGLPAFYKYKKDIAYILYYLTNAL